MKGWLARAAVSSARRGRYAGGLGGARWFSRTSAVDPSRFQGPDEPYPGHWRRWPAPWPADATTPTRVSAALRSLPEKWRTALRARDGEHRPPEQVAEELGLTTAQEQQVVGQARAALREQLASSLDEQDPS